MSDGGDDAGRNITDARLLTPLPPSLSIPAKRKQATIDRDDELPTPTAPPTTTGNVDNNAIRCICGSTTDDGLSIACDVCERWCHAACFDIVLGEIPEEWRCWECSPRPVDRDRAARLQKERLPVILEAQRVQQEREQAHGRAEGAAGGNGDKGRRRASPGTDKKQRRTTVESSTSKRRRRLSVAQPPAPTPTTVAATAAATTSANATASGEDELLDIEDSWAHSYVHISEDIITSEETRQRLHRQAQQWRGVSALASDTPRTAIRPIDPKLAVHPALSPAANLDARTPVYAVHTTTHVPAESLITPYTSVLTPSSAYVSDSLNGYALMGHPKPFVHLIGAPYHLALDSRMAGNESRFVRNGCKPNAVIRPLLCQPDSSTLKFGVFASRDLKENEEVVLGWEWDDGNVVHSLPAIIEDPGMFANRWGATCRPEEVHHAKKQVANILHTLGSTFTTCACGARARDCAFTVMAEFVNDDEPTNSSPVVPYSIRRKPDLGALLGGGKKRGFLAREKVPWSGGMGGVEEVVQLENDTGHQSDASTSSSVPIVRVEPASPLRRTPSLKGKERAMDIDVDVDGVEEQDGSERVRSSSNGKHVSFVDESIYRERARRDIRSSSPPSDHRDLRPPDPPDDETEMEVDEDATEDEEDIPPTLPMATEDLMPPKMRKRWIHKTFDELRERGAKVELALVAEEGSKSDDAMQGVDEEGSVQPAPEDTTAAITMIDTTTTTAVPVPPFEKPPSASPATSFARLSLISPSGTAVVLSGTISPTMFAAPNPPSETKKSDEEPTQTPIVVLPEEEPAQPSREVKENGRDQLVVVVVEEVEHLPLNDDDKRKPGHSPPRELDHAMTPPPHFTPSPPPTDSASIAITIDTTAPVVRYPNNHFLNVVMGGDVDSVASTPQLGGAAVLDAGSSSSAASTPAPTVTGEIADGDIHMGEVNEEEGKSEDGKGDEGPVEMGNEKQGDDEPVPREREGYDQEEEEDQMKHNEQQQQPPQAKVKLSLKDFALRKRKQREEEQKAHRVEVKEDIRPLPSVQEKVPAVAVEGTTTNGVPAITREVKQELVKTAMEPDIRSAPAPRSLRGDDPEIPGLTVSPPRGAPLLSTTTTTTTTTFSPTPRQSSMSIASLVSPPLRNIEMQPRNYQPSSNHQGPKAAITPIPPSLPTSAPTAPPVLKAAPISRSSTIEDDTVSLGESDDESHHAPHQNHRSQQEPTTTTVSSAVPEQSRPSAPIPTRPSIPDRPRNPPSAPFTYRHSTAPRPSLPLPPIPVTSQASTRKGPPTGPSTKPFNPFLPPRPTAAVPPPSAAGSGYQHMAPAVSMAPRSVSSGGYGNGSGGRQASVGSAKPLPSGPAALRQHEYGGGGGGGSASSGGSFTRDRSTATPTPPPPSAVSSTAYSNSSSAVAPPPLSSSSSSVWSARDAQQQQQQPRIPTAPRIRRPPVDRPSVPRSSYPPPLSASPPPSAHNSYTPSYSHGPDDRDVKWSKGSRLDEQPPQPRRDQRVGNVPEYQIHQHQHHQRGGSGDHRPPRYHTTENGNGIASASATTASVSANGRKSTMYAPGGGTPCNNMPLAPTVATTTTRAVVAAPPSGMPPREPRAFRVASFMAEQRKQQQQQQFQFQQGPGG